MAERQYFTTPKGPAVPPHKVAAWGAHLLAIDHWTLYIADCKAGDQESAAHHLERHIALGKLEIGLRSGEIKYLPGLPENEHAMCYRKAISVLKP